MMKSNELLCCEDNVFSSETDDWKDVRLLAHSEDDVFGVQRVLLDPSLLLSSPNETKKSRTINYCEPVQIVISISSEIVFTFVLEFSGFLTKESNHALSDDNRTTTDDHNNSSHSLVSSVIVHSEIISLIEERLGTDEKSNRFKCIVEPLLHSSQLTVNTNNDVEILVSMFNPKDSQEILNFMERIALFSEKSIFKKHVDLFNSLIKTKLLGRYVVDGQVTLIEFMGVRYPILIRFKSSQNVANRKYMQVTRDAIVKFNSSSQAPPIANVASLQKLTNDQLLYKERTKTFIENISSDSIGGLDEQLAKITEILGR